MTNHEPIDHHELEAWVDHLYEVSDAEICRILGAFIDRMHEAQARLESEDIQDEAA